MKWISILLLLLTFVPSFGQNFLSWQYNDRYFSLQAGTGKTMYQGELRHNKQFQNGLAHFTVGLEARLLSRIAARTEFSFYYLKGSDTNAPDSTWAQQRNLSFYSLNYEASIQGIFFLKKYRGDYFKRWGMDPYLFVGAGVTGFNPKTKFEGETYVLHKYRTEGTDYIRATMVFPMGIGAKFRINEFLNFNVEGSYRPTLSDYLDDVSTTYPHSFENPVSGLLSNRKNEVGLVNEEAYDQLTAGGKRGDSSNKDSYFFISFKLEMFLPPGLFRSNRAPFLKKSSAAQ